MFKKINYRFLLLFLLVQSLVFSLFSFSGGTGTLADPYNITTCQHLQDMNLDLAANYTLGSDIDCTGFNFKPVGNCTGPCTLFPFAHDPFTGSFNGNFNSIFNLTINASGYEVNDGWGLFGSVYEGIISNVTLENVLVLANTSSSVGSLIGYSSFMNPIVNIHSQGYVYGSNRVGGLVGLTDTSIFNSSFSGFVSGESSVGGLSGESGSIRDSNSDASVTGISDVGGLSGITLGLSNSSFRGSVTGITRVGGLAATVTSANGGLIKNSFSSGIVVGEDVVGGIAAILRGQLSPSVINNSYSNVSITGNNSVGGLVGDSYISLISNSYFSGSLSGNSSVGGLIGLNNNTNISNSFTTSSVTGIDLSTTGSLIGELISGTMFNNFWNNISQNPTGAVGLGSSSGINDIQDDISYFYDNSNSPFNGNWDSNIWNFTGNNLPYLSWQENPNSQIGFTSQSTASLFPIGGMVVSLLLILCFLLF